MHRELYDTRMHKSEKEKVLKIKGQFRSKTRKIELSKLKLLLIVRKENNDREVLFFVFQSNRQKSHKKCDKKRR